VPLANTRSLEAASASTPSPRQDNLQNNPPTKANPPARSDLPSHKITAAPNNQHDHKKLIKRQNKKPIVHDQRPAKQQLLGTVPRALQELAISEHLVVGKHVLIRSTTGAARLRLKKGTPFVRAFIAVSTTGELVIHRGSLEEVRAAFQSKDNHATDSAHDRTAQIETYRISPAWSVDAQTREKDGVTSVIWSVLLNDSPPTAGPKDGPPLISSNSSRHAQQAQSASDGSTLLSAKFRDPLAFQQFAGIFRTSQLLACHPRDWTAISHHRKSQNVSPEAYARLLEASHQVRCPLCMHVPSSAAL